MVLLNFLVNQEGSFVPKAEGSTTFPNTQKQIPKFQSRTFKSASSPPQGVIFMNTGAMHYSATVLLVHITHGISISVKYGAVVKQALHLTLSAGTLDILIMNSPLNEIELETTTREFYELCRKEGIEESKESIQVNVLLDGRDIELERNQAWEVLCAGAYEADLPTELRKLVPDSCDIQGLPVVILNMDESYLHIQERGVDEPASCKAGIRQYEMVAGKELLYFLWNLIKWKYAKIYLVGGTFDHLHDGHKLLLTIAGYITLGELIIGLTGE